jgi:hypothetical protein
MPTLNFEDYLRSPERSQVAETTMRLLFTFIGELSREEQLNYKTQLLLCRIAPSLCQLADENSEIFSNSKHPVRQIIANIVIISKSIDTGAGDYLYRSLKESIKTLTERNIDGAACLQRVASDLEYIVKLSKIRSSKTDRVAVGGTRSGIITQSKLKAAFFVVTEATKFDCSDEVLYFALGQWLELLTVAFIKFPSNARMETEMKRMTFLLFYLNLQSTKLNERIKKDMLAESLVLKLKRCVRHLGKECLGYSVDLSHLEKKVTDLIASKFQPFISAASNY